MNEKSDFNYRSAILRLLLNILVYTLIVHIVVAVFCYLIGWRHIYLYGHSLVWGGVIVIALGLTSAVGGSPSMQMKGANPAFMTQYLKRRDSDKIGSYRFLILSGVVGILTILSGLYIQTL